MSYGPAVVVVLRSVGKKVLACRAGAQVQVPELFQGPRTTRPRQELVPYIQTGHAVS